MFRNLLRSMKIYIVDSNGFKFSNILARGWTKMGHEVRSFHCLHMPLYDWADIVYFDFADNNVKWLSKYANGTQLKDNIPYDPKKTHVVRCVDIEAYAGHPGPVDWTKFDACIFISEHIQKYCQDKFPSLKGVKQHLVRCGVETDKFHIIDREPTDTFDIGFLGRLWIGKNFPGVLDVLYECKKRCDKVKLHVRADGYDPAWWEAFCKHRIKALGLEDNIVYYDYIEDLTDWYNKLDYVIVPSFKEAFSYAAGEAAACGVQPLILNSPEMDKTWPESWRYNTPSEAAAIIMGTDYDRKRVRQFILDNYSAEKHILETSKICKIPTKDLKEKQ